MGQESRNICARQCWRCQPKPLILEMGKLKPRGVMPPAQRHTASEGQNLVWPGRSALPSPYQGHEWLEADTETAFSWPCCLWSPAGWACCCSVQRGHRACLAISACVPASIQCSWESEAAHATHSEWEGTREWSAGLCSPPCTHKCSVKKHKHQVISPLLFWVTIFQFCTLIIKGY